VTGSGTAVVTGASRGIGRAVSLELARRGIDVVATMRDPAAGTGLADAGVTVTRLDVDDPDTMRLPESLTILVNNAGIDGVRVSVEDTPLDDWRQVFETNVFGLVELTRGAIPILRANGGGVIVNLLSSAIVVPMPFYATYRASKAAVQAFSESLRPEVAPFGIHVMDVLPGPVDTDMLTGSKAGGLGRHSAPYQELADRVASLRASEPSTPVDDAARTIVDALLSDPPPHRVGCDPMGADLLAGWAATPDAEWQATFLDAFRI
jgi:NAD(P)-dependent dehydrogenase (short-subunit alcohol dehydrogenase family)